MKKKNWTCTFLCKLVDSKYNRFFYNMHFPYTFAPCTTMHRIEYRALTYTLARTSHCTVKCVSAQRAKQRTLLRITQFIYIQLCYFTLLINAYAKAVVSLSCSLFASQSIEFWGFLFRNCLCTRCMPILMYAQWWWAHFGEKHIV